MTGVIKRGRIKSKWFPAANLFGLMLFSVGSLAAKTFPLTASPAVPAASGKVEVKKDKNGNTGVTIKAEHLAKPDRLTPPATIYVVWFRERNGEPVSQGALKVKKDLTGEFEATTA